MAEPVALASVRAKFDAALEIDEDDGDEEPTDGDGEEPWADEAAGPQVVIQHVHHLTINIMVD